MLSVAIASWLLLATAFTASGGLARIGFPFPQVVLVGLTLLLGAIHRASPALRDAVRALPLEALVLLHTSRCFVGSYFLWLCHRGELAYAFAVPAGYGDIAVALLAAVLLRFPSLRPGAAAPSVRAWNLLGLADILFVVATAARVGSQAPETMAPLVRLPLGLLPTFLVPLIVYSHAVIGFRGIESGSAERL